MANPLRSLIEELSEPLDRLAILQQKVRKSPPEALLKYSPEILEDILIQSQKVAKIITSFDEEQE